MNTETLVNAGIRLDYSPNAMVPEIPYIEDVLYVLNLNHDDKYYRLCMSNHSTYIANVALVVAAISDEVLNMELYDEKLARRMIAKAIIDLCPDNARCLFNQAFAEAKKELGDDPPQATSADELRQACGCEHCREGC